MKKYDAIVFDVGDTLIRFAPDYAEIFGDRIARLGHFADAPRRRAIAKAVHAAVGEQVRREQRGERRATDEELLRRMDEGALAALVGQPTAGQLAELDALCGVPLPAQRRVVIDGVPQLLARLGAAGYRLAIVSNFAATLRDFLEEIGLAQCFEVIVVSGAVGVEKPDPRIMRIALDALGAPPDRCLYVGDHPLDVLCAKLAGMDAAWIADEGDALPPDMPYAEDHRLPGVADLAALLGA
ncbi:MAG: HAD family hydrolase [Clostridiales bacterium]|nr:HAD family hydrolase [Clostridiales bacterium]